MLAYLSDEWITAVDEALGARLAGATDPSGSTGPSGSGAAPLTLTIHQTVTGGPHGDRSYILWFDGDRAGATRRPPAGTEPDVSLTCDWDTAVAISTGKERAQSAFLAGRLRLGGDSRTLLAHAGVLADLDDVLASVRARTDYTG